MLIGYIRVSTKAQNTDRQIDALSEAKCEKIFIDKKSGATADRPELNKMFEILRKGDVVIVSELARFGRSTKDLISLLNRLQKMNVEFKSLKEPFIDTTTPQGNMVFTIFSAFAQFERELSNQRIKEGLKAAKQRGRVFGRPHKDAESVKLAISMKESGKYTMREITEKTGISKSAIYSYIQKAEDK